MNRFALSLCLAGCLLGAGRTATAQTTTPPYDANATLRSVQAAQLWPELQGELALRNGDYLLLALRGEYDTDAAAARRLGFSARRVTLGYEHFWNSNWSWGATARYESGSSLNQRYYDIIAPELLVRHRSPVFGGFTFGQRLSLERQLPFNSPTYGGSGPAGQNWTRLRVDIERLYPLTSDAAAGLALRPRLSYEASTHLRLQKAEGDLNERTIQYTSLRAEVGVRMSPHLDLTPWFAYQTIYFLSEPQYDKNNMQVSGGKDNNVYPTVGLEVRFTLLPTGGKPTRQQLPTQH
ncbi:hypothetical protein [Hymenobacter baengnokdamensis]|uniref:hypothetical protein n=1 Tax=Hymenobacter baengnokdamensis TaxID=2615203 RepID=UPI001246C55E|nr:hypothetical protein [Hymenobacter baengnokdamensis]